MQQHPCDNCSINALDAHKPNHHDQYNSSQNTTQIKELQYFEDSHPLG